jgi:hypothetical protein
VPVVLVAYSIWLKDLLSNPSLLLQIITGAYKPERSEIGLTPGVTSLINLAPAFHCIYAFRLVDGSEQRPARWFHLCFAIVAGLTLFRVYIWSERLAMIEMAVPFGLAAGRWMATSRLPAVGALRLLGPYAALPFVILYFGVAEYYRSWTSGTYNGKMDFWDFAIGRFASYYYTALNNAAGFAATQPRPLFEFEFILEWAHKAPFGVGKIFSEFVGFQGPRWEWYLESYQDPEFNSPSALFTVVADLGLMGALGYMLLVGLVSGMIFRMYRQGRLAGVLVFPLFFISFLELFRYPYLGQPRAFTWVLGMIVVALAVQVIRAMPGRRLSSRDRHHVKSIGLPGAVR